MTVNLHNNAQTNGRKKLYSFINNISLEIYSNKIKQKATKCGFCLDYVCIEKRRFGHTFRPNREEIEFRFGRTFLRSDSLNHCIHWKWRKKLHARILSEYNGPALKKFLSKLSSVRIWREKNPLYDVTYATHQQLYSNNWMCTELILHEFPIHPERAVLSRLHATNVSV